jgi:hypothetical protein
MSFRINPDDVQILFADLQPTLVASSATTTPAGLALSAGVLAKAASILKLPMVFSLVPQAGEPGVLIPELAEYATPANTFQRFVGNVFLHPETAQAITANKRKCIVVAGFAAEVVVLHSSLAALEAGYSVQVPLDAVGGRSVRTEGAALGQIERAGGVMTSVLSLVTGLAPDFSCAPGAQTLEALRALRPAPR